MNSACGSSSWEDGQKRKSPVSITETGDYCFKDKTLFLKETINSLCNLTTTSHGADYERGTVG